MTSTRQSLKKHVLEETISLNCKVFGLVTTSTFLELASTLKRNLLIPFHRGPDIEWKAKKVEHAAPVYIYYDTGIETQYALIRNKADIGWIAKEYQNVDALLIETNYAGTFGLKLAEISKSKSIQFCFEIQVSTLDQTTQKRLDIN